MEEAPVNASTTPVSPLRSHHVAVAGGRIHVVEGGAGLNPTLVFLHGWPQTWLEFEPVMSLLRATAHVVALDLPGVGGSVFPDAPGGKRAIAEIVHDVVQAMELKNVTLVGHDIGGMTTFAYLVRYGEELSGAVMMDMGVPGIDPWNEMISHPGIWRLAFHAVPQLPEIMVGGRQAAYFDFFYNAVNAHPEAIAPQSRERYVEAYSDPAALKTGFDWYRAFAQDARDNAAFAASPARIATPVLYIRGEKHGREIEQYVRGFRAAGLDSVVGAVIPDCGHFANEEQPQEVARLISSFIGI